MSKSTNKMQLQELFNLMEANPDIARGFFKGGKEELVRFWKKVEEDLNCMGPPTKCIVEWKKVWADQKKYVRQKAAQNLKYKNGTGGGPNKEVKFSGLEEAIYNLVGMKTAVEGMAAQVFAIVAPIVTSMPDIVVPSAAEVANIIQADEEEEILADVAQKTVMANSSKPSKSAKRVANKSLKPDSASEALQQELSIQKEIVDTLKEACQQRAEDSKQELQQSKRLTRYMEKVYDLQKAHFKQMELMKREEIDEMRRHNLHMEKIRAIELEYLLEKNNLKLQQ